MLVGRLAWSVAISGSIVRPLPPAWPPEPPACPPRPSAMSTSASGSAGDVDICFWQEQPSTDVGERCAPPSCLSFSTSSTFMSASVHKPYASDCAHVQQQELARTTEKWRKLRPAQPQPQKSRGKLCPAQPQPWPQKSRQKLCPTRPLNRHGGGSLVFSGCLAQNGHV